ncbi:IclR family transcriptional regulator C-terminal domain-containing protein [Micromonospora sp. NPDC049523]|uniref:IclR family transcriptional regulator n=1 Tax=Micromonospora sp. NPDC049523 TaxID=3155921 RepID=UPI00341BB1E7
MTKPPRHPPAELAGRQPAAVVSALTVLEEVARAGPGVTAKEISTALGLPPATTYRLVNLLVGEEYLVRLADLRGFALGRKVIELAGAAAREALPPGVPEVVTALRTRVRLAVHLVRYRDGRLRLVDPDPDHPPSPEALLARHLHASAVGKLLLAERRDLWPVSLARLTPATITRPDLLDLELAGVRSEQAARQLGELRRDRGCLAFPVRGRAGDLLAGLAVSTSPDRVGRLDRAVLRLVGRCVDELADLLALDPT